ncbi:uncharacterized protein F4807DRAFT_459523 [Annulohypoxylon truncatum]|uniref:uncharacterized protein n=1 Tax=Annulohypoxylon truncatum TaxID=327061 RepID=UPI0020072013|nr:uncharacterized protein F4807DRAFT_459523 [Annulohypoxylon truncatum]KAI1210682.1 hypothetical protein F4807DRAFT_459523 [Annulohypoxylon truncatum]
MEPGLSLLLLWSLWSTTSLGLGNFASNGDTLESREKSDGENNPVAVRWVVAGRNDEARLPSITAAPALPTVASSAGTPLQIRQAATDTDGDIDDGPPPPPPPPLNPAQSNSISNSVSASVSSSVAASVTGVYSSSLQAMSAASTSAVASARIAGIAEGMSSAIAGMSASTTTGITSSTSATSATGTDAASAIANIQTSASKAVEEAQASASSSAQSAVAAAQASASAVTTPQSQGSSLTPGQIGGIVISIAFISSLLSALATFLLMRRKARQQDAPSKYEPESPYIPRTQEPVLPPVPEPRPHSLSQSIRNRLSSFHAMLSGPIIPPYRRSQSPSNLNSSSDAFAADIKRRPPTAEHPAISQNARPLSDPAFPVSPVSSVGDQSLILQGNEPEARLQPSPPMPVVVEAPPSPVTVTDTSTSAGPSAPSARVSLAREQSISGGQRPHLVRVGSGRERSGAGGHPLSMHPVCGDEGYDAAPVSATGQCHIVLPIRSPADGDEHAGWRASVGTELSTASSFHVQAPIPRRLVDPISLERGPNYLPHAY